jgi:hypothetical protein
MTVEQKRDLHRALGRCVNDEYAYREALSDSRAFLRARLEKADVDEIVHDRFVAIMERLRDGGLRELRARRPDIGIWSVV